MVPISIEEIQNALAEPITRLGYEWVGAEFAQEGHERILRIYADRPQGGITVDELSNLHHHILDGLSVAGISFAHLGVEVSSPGLARPLFTLEQCRRFVGRRVKMQLSQPVLHYRKFQGTLMAVTDVGLSLEVGTDTLRETIQVPWVIVKKANLVPEFRPSLWGE